MYQRFAFDHLTPERQSDLLSKQMRQQQQRAMLDEQLAAKRSRTAPINENIGNDQFASTQPIYTTSKNSEQQDLPQFSRTMRPEVFVPEINLRPPAFTLQNRSQRMRDKNIARSSSISPNKIHDNFLLFRQSMRKSVDSSFSSTLSPSRLNQATTTFYDGD